MTDPYRVCVVCTGNICRSPMGEVILRELLERGGLADKVIVDSAGTGGWHVGDQADHRTLAALEKAGYDGADHRARQLVETDLTERDLIVVADRSHLHDVERMARGQSGIGEIRLLREFDANADKDEVDDPYYGDGVGFDRCRDEVEAACRGLVEHLRVELDQRCSGPR